MQRIAPFCYYYQELSGLHALELAVVELGVEAVCSKQLVVAARCVEETVIEVLVVAGVAALAQWLLSVCNNRITFLVSRDLRNEALRKIQTLPLSYLDSHHKAAHHKQGIRFDFAQNTGQGRCV